MSTSDGSTADYYQLPPGSTELQHLISHRDMNAQIGEIFRACYRYGIASHSSRMRDAKKIRFYIEAEIARLEALELATQPAFDWSGALAEQEAADNRAHLSAVMGFNTARADDKLCDTDLHDVNEAARRAFELERAAAGSLVHDYGHTVVVEEPRIPSPLREQFIGALDAMQEPAAQIDDESDRQKAIDQNGNDGAVYDDPWYGAPEWARFKAQDRDGSWCWYDARPVLLNDKWACKRGVSDSKWSYVKEDLEPAHSTNWRDTLIERTSGQDPRE